ncbi:DUF1326 domain-containing protein [Arhodomonas sp. AD133]|uniref:DUF1326 domain-containing protein n=1 Tax=Arhodomonas sp. AD133 TaxID=3415009 RepID=UPI003EBD0AEF
MSTQWQLSGTYFEACTCTGACPCLYGEAPTEGTCDALVAWHVERGHHGSVELDGMNLAMALHAPGNMTAGGWKVAVYVDDAASEAQRDALVEIFSGAAGGHPGTLASFVGETLGVESVPMHYDASGRRRSLKVGDLAAASLEAIEGQGGGEVRISGHPVAVSPGYDVTVAKSDSVSHRGYGLDWEFGGRVAYYAPFRYEAA